MAALPNSAELNWTQHGNHLEAETLDSVCSPLLCQVVGFWGLIRVGAIEVPANSFALRAPMHVGWMFLLGYGIGSALLTTLIVVPLSNTVFPKGLQWKAALVRLLVFLLAVFLDFLVMHLIK
jgi:hypothetical protein